MSLYKRGKTWHTDFMVNGQRYRQSLDTTDWREAQSKEKELIAQASAASSRPQVNSSRSSTSRKQLNVILRIVQLTFSPEASGRNPTTPSLYGNTSFAFRLDALIWTRYWSTQDTARLAASRIQR